MIDESKEKLTDITNELWTAGGNGHRTQLDVYNEILISKSVRYADHINELYRDGIEYHSFPVIPEENKVPWFDKHQGDKIR